MTIPMKTSIRSVIAVLPMLALSAVGAHAHAVWVVPVEGGYKVHYGEPGEGELENKEKLAGLGPMQIRDSSGKTVKGVLHEDHVFAIAGAGGVTVSALEAPLYGEGEHAGRPYWHARFIADPGKKLAPTAGAALEILPDGKDSVSFAVLKGGKPLAGEGVTLFAPTGWSKSFKTDAAGKLRIETPWPGLYVLEVGVEEKGEGKLKDKPYANVYNAYTLSFVKR
jgi:hypothetical protein